MVIMKKPRQNTKAFCVEFVFLILLVIENQTLFNSVKDFSDHE